jgi:hypothetical protein
VTKRVRVPGVPVDFRVPRGWPTPTDRWIRENVLWSPPPGWTPLPGAPSAPSGWQYWTPNDQWSTFTATYYRPIRKWNRTANWLGVLWIVATVAGIVYPASIPFHAVAVVALLAGVGFALAYQALDARTTRDILANLAIVADQERARRLTRAYQRYLTDAA